MALLNCLVFKLSVVVDYFKRKEKTNLNLKFFAESETGIPTRIILMLKNI